VDVDVVNSDDPGQDDQPADETAEFMEATGNADFDGQLGAEAVDPFLR